MKSGRCRQCANYDFSKPRTIVRPTVGDTYCAGTCEVKVQQKGGRLVRLDRRGGSCDYYKSRREV